jgi:hypothetical protein
LEGPEFISQKQLADYDFNIYDKYNLDQKFKFPKGGAKKVRAYFLIFIVKDSSSQERKEKQELQILA